MDGLLEVVLEVEPDQVSLPDEHTLLFCLIGLVLGFLGDLHAMLEVGLNLFVLALNQSNGGQPLVQKQMVERVRPHDAFDFFYGFLQLSARFIEFPLHCVLKRLLVGGHVLDYVWVAFLGGEAAEAS